MLSWLWKARIFILAVSCVYLPPFAAAEDRPQVRVESVSETDIITEVQLNGTVNPLRSSRLSTPVPGLLSEVLVETGSRVSQGDVLIRLDDEQAALELEQANASVAEARASLSEARRRLDEARSVGAGRNIAATEISARESEVARAEAALDQLTAEQRRRKVVLDRHNIKAPFAGVVTRRESDLGEWVTPGDELLKLVDTGNLRLDFQVPQTHYARIDGRARLTILQQRGNREAEIETLVPVTDTGARTFLLRALAPETLEVIPGMAVQAVLRTNSDKRGLTVSRDAINRYPDGRTTVWLLIRSDKERMAEVSEKRIRTGSTFQGRVEVSEGLEEGAEVVVRGNESLREGVKVTLAGEGTR